MSKLLVETHGGETALQGKRQTGRMGPVFFLHENPATSSMKNYFNHTSPARPHGRAFCFVTIPADQVATGVTNIGL